MHETKRAVYETYIQNLKRHPMTRDVTWKLCLFFGLRNSATSYHPNRYFRDYLVAKREKSINDLLPINKPVSKVGPSVILFRSSFRQNLRSLKA